MGHVSVEMGLAIWLKLGRGLFGNNGQLLTAPALIGCVKDSFSFLLLLFSIGNYFGHSMVASVVASVAVLRTFSPYSPF